MAYTEFVNAIDWSMCMICENEPNLSWTYRSSKPSSPELSLEEEINRLRLKMCEAATREKSLTAETVVEISRLLDKKINEYMVGKK